MRMLGVEEELLLVDARSGQPAALAPRVLAAAEDSDPAEGAIEAELQQQQIEIDTPPAESLSDLAAQISTWRAKVDDLARDHGVRAVALGTSPVPVQPDLVPKHRYRRMADRFGLTTSEQLTCGCHVHVDIDSPEEGVAVIDRIRVWLPVLVAISANSPYWQGIDSGYASYRSQAWLRFPTAGPTERFGELANYRRVVSALLATEVPMDDGMIYFDARLSAKYPTVEIRTADVCLRSADTVLIAGLARALVETAARAAADGEPAPDVSADLVRMARWRASRSGLDGALLDPVTMRPRPAADVVAALLEHVRAAAADLGDEETIEAGLERVLEGGNGAAFQRGYDGPLEALLLAAADLTRE